MAYAPDNLTITSWSSPVTIAGTDLIKNLDEAVNQIVSTDTNSLKNHINTELAKIPPYMTSEFNKIYDGVEDNATIAQTSATTATTKASEASTSASDALSYRNSAQGYASNALANANISTDNATTATTQAGIATTKAGEALASKNSAEASATTATTKAIEAVVSASNAQASALIVNAYANLDWAGFTVSDGELIVEYFNSSLSTPSLVDGELILTY